MLSQLADIKHNLNFVFCAVIYYIILSFNVIMLVILHDLWTILHGNLKHKLYFAEVVYIGYYTGLTIN